MAADKISKYPKASIGEKIVIFALLAILALSIFVYFFKDMNKPIDDMDITEEELQLPVHEQ